MFKYFKSEDTLIDEIINNLKQPEELLFGEGNLKFTLKTSDLFKKALDSNMKTLMADLVVELLLEENTKSNMVTRLQDFYKTKIDNNEFVIWNNAVYYYGMSSNNFFAPEITYHLVDKFVKDYDVLAKLSIQSVKDYVNKRIELDDLEMYYIDKNYYLSEYFTNIFNQTVDMLTTFSNSIDIELDIEMDFGLYNKELTLKENLEDKILNLDDVIDGIKNVKYEINNEIYDFSSIIDTDSFTNSGVFLNIPKLNNDCWVELMLLNGEPVVLVFNYMKKEQGTDEEYDLVFELLKEYKI